MDLNYETRKTLDLLLSEIDLSEIPQRRERAFRKRINEHFPRLFALFLELYGNHYDAYVYLRKLVQSLAAHQISKQPTGLTSDTTPWFQSEREVGMAVYVDLFAGDLAGLIDRIPHLQTLGITYLHLMPLYLAPEGNSDGGYAVSDYRTVDPRLGDSAALRKLGEALHKAGIRMVLDFVFNHTSDEHRWARAALAGDTRFEEFYYLFDEAEAKAYDETLREIFPQVRRGSFTWIPSIGKWVWTTFNSFQWDLNYANPDVFVSVVEEMLHLVSMGCDVLRLDALAFVWKEKGTVCESLPKAHTVIRAFKACLDLAAPHVVFKSEAIVHPDEVNSYIGTEECELSYNPLMMALMWESLATRNTALLNASLARSFAIPEGTAWVNYIRCHDDIGWTWDDAISAGLGIDGYDHRQFLNRFYTGRFEGSFAEGVPFAENPTTGDCRVCGTLAALAGVGGAAASGDTQELHHALRRVRLLHGVMLAMPGLPLIYQGDDLGVLNDESYLTDPTKAEDSRWVHRKALEPVDFARATDPGTPQGRIARELAQLIAARKSHAVFGASGFRLFETGNPHVFGFLRETAEEVLLVLANFSEHHVALGMDPLALPQGLVLRDLLAPGSPETPMPLSMGAYELRWLHAIR
jgi:amylosucrase